MREEPSGAGPLIGPGSKIPDPTPVDGCDRFEVAPTQLPLGFRTLLFSLRRVLSPKP